MILESTIYLDGTVAGLPARLPCCRSQSAGLLTVWLLSRLRLCPFLAGNYPSLLSSATNGRLVHCSTISGPIICPKSNYVCQHTQNTTVFTTHASMLRQETSCIHRPPSPSLTIRKILCAAASIFATLKIKLAFVSRIHWTRRPAVYSARTQKITGPASCIQRRPMRFVSPVHQKPSAFPRWTTPVFDESAYLPLCSQYSHKKNTTFSCKVCSRNTTR